MTGGWPDSDVRCKTDCSYAVTALCNLSPQLGCFLADFKNRPVSKKLGVSSADLGSCLTISNLSILPEPLERLIFRPLSNYLTSPELLPLFKTRFRPGFSSETTLTRPVGFIVCPRWFHSIASSRFVSDRRQCWSRILLQRLQTSFEIFGHSSGLWRSTGFRFITDSRYSICRWLISGINRIQNKKSCFVAASVCWWYSHL